MNVEKYNMWNITFAACIILIFFYPFIDSIIRFLVRSLSGRKKKSILKGDAISPEQSFELNDSDKEFMEKCIETINFDLRKHMKLDENAAIKIGIDKNCPKVIDEIIKLYESKGWNVEILPSKSNRQLTTKLLFSLPEKIRIDASVVKEMNLLEKDLNNESNSIESKFLKLERASRKR